MSGYFILSLNKWKFFSFSVAMKKFKITLSSLHLYNTQPKAKEDNIKTQCPAKTEFLARHRVSDILFDCFINPLAAVIISVKEEILHL